MKRKFNVIVSYITIYLTIRSLIIHFHVILPIIPLFAISNTPYSKYDMTYTEHQT
ncbi:hypothetical protein [Bacillus paramycoides]|uniref:hypothetical protein n=1 Tax=Bacillus paramycoides TaxID=2026194 RepID=UPI003D059332